MRDVKLCFSSDRTLAKNVQNDIAELNIGYRQAILKSVFLARFKVGQLSTIAHQISKLSNDKWWHKATCDKVMLDQVGNPLSILIIRFFTANRFDVLGVGEGDVA